MNKRKQQEPIDSSLANLLRELCERADAGSLSEQDLETLRTVALDNGIYAVRNLSPSGLCRSLMTKLAMNAPSRPAQVDVEPRRRWEGRGAQALPMEVESARTSRPESEYAPLTTFPQFSMLPADVQGVVWRQYFGANAPREAVVRRAQRIGSLSKGQERIIRGLARQILPNAPPFPGTQVGPSDYGDWIGCPDLGFDERNCRLLYDGFYWLDLPDDREGIAGQLKNNTELARMFVQGGSKDEGFLRLSESNVLQNLDTVAWPCSCVTIQFPLFTKIGRRIAALTLPSDLYMRKQFFSDKGHFTVMDLLVLVSDFLLEKFTPTEWQQVEQILSEELRATGENITTDDLFFRYWPGTLNARFYADVTSGQMAKSDLFSGKKFGYLEERQDANGDHFLDTIWVR